MAKAVQDATQDFSRAVETARATKSAIGIAESVHEVNAGAAEAVKRIQARQVIQKAGVPDSGLSQNLMLDIQAMEGAGGGERMSKAQTEMINHLVAGLAAQGKMRRRSTNCS